MSGKEGASSSPNVSAVQSRPEAVGSAVVPRWATRPPVSTINTRRPASLGMSLA